ncbi:VCBS repeat-containing protein [Streptomyces sp. NPDC050095]|uniref:FG-GAP repeat domain-containing protein n=1 Tax=unclassified Streptomyces TaxID=2593676 RepID=UPI0034328E14
MGISGISVPRRRAARYATALGAGAALVLGGVAVPSAGAVAAPIDVSVTEGSTVMFHPQGGSSGSAGDVFTYTLSGTAAWGTVAPGLDMDCGAAGRVLTCTATEGGPAVFVVAAQIVVPEGTGGAAFTVATASPHRQDTYAYTVAERPTTAQTLSGPGSHTLTIKAPAPGAHPDLGSAVAFNNSGWLFARHAFTFRLPPGVTADSPECTQAGQQVTCERRAGAGPHDYRVPVTVADDAAEGTVTTEGVAAADGGSNPDRVPVRTPFTLRLTVDPKGAAARHDHDGDGRSDLAVWYTYGDRRSGLHTLTAAADGTLGQPFGSYASNPGSWNIDRMQFASGDFNGDGRADAAMLYDYLGGRVRLMTALATPDGGFGRPVGSWESNPGGFYGTSMTLQSGDFDGDGRDDLAAWYAYSDGRNRIFTFAAGADGSFAAPVNAHEEPTSWQRRATKMVTGDFNGDGRDDLAALYGASDGTLTLHTFLATADGRFTRTASWSSKTFGNFARAYPHAGDFNGDGIGDIALWYDYADGRDAVFTFAADREGRFAGPVTAYQAKAGSWTYGNMKPLTGDYDGDGRDDLATLYGYSDGRIAMFTWPSGPGGTLTAPRTGWRSDGKGYNHRAATLISPYNN